VGTGVLSKGLPGLQSEVRFNFLESRMQESGNSHGRLQIAVEQWSLTVRKCTFSLSHCPDPVSATARKQRQDAVRGRWHM
jgi:hypothetical protein